jgi:hypothetical protein
VRDVLLRLLVLGSAVGVYVLSIFVHPYTACEGCNGTGRHRGSLFGYAFRPCEKCSGVGRKQRFGARLFNRGEPRKGGSQMP